MKRLPAAVAVLLLVLSCRDSGPDMTGLERRAEALRGLKFRRPVAVESVDGARMGQVLRAEAEAQMQGPAWSGAERSLKTFGLVPRKMDLKRALLDLLDSQVVGLYDPKGKRLYVVQGAGEGIREDYGDLPGLPEEFSWGDLFVLHELVHALADQHFDLETLPLDDLADGDRASAARCVVEGDATWVMLEDLFDTLKATPAQREKLSDLPAALGLGREVMGSAIPRYLTENLMVSYLAGNALVAEARRRGGIAAVDALYRKPPRSMEEALHPEKYFAGDDPPRAVAEPGPPAGRAGEERLFAGRWGEFDTRLILEAWGVPETVATAASEGWGGDAYAVFGRAGGPAGFAWETVWDTPADAAEFAACLAGVSGVRVTAAGDVVRVECDEGPPRQAPVPREAKEAS